MAITRVAALAGLLLLSACNQHPSAAGPEAERGGLKANASVAAVDLARSAIRGCAKELPAGFGYPKAAQELRDIATKPDVAAQRAHGWNLLAAATQPADSADATSLPIFMTWYGEAEAFDQTPGKVDCANRRAVFGLEPSTQFLMAADNPVSEALKRQGVVPNARFDPDPAEVQGLAEARSHDGAVFSHVAFNQKLYDYIRDNRFYSKDELDKLIDPSVARKPAPPPPAGSLSSKSGWWPVAATGLTPVPVWDPPATQSDAVFPPKDWNRVVVVDPTGTAKPPTQVVFNKKEFANPRLVSLDRFFHVTLDQDSVAAANANWRLRSAAKLTLGRDLKVGDHVVMVALHINTNEFQPWVFTSFWWHDEPGKGEFASGRPTAVTGPWRNYLMGVSYNINLPREANGAADIVQNPYLELFQEGGTRSACMACHARAAYSRDMRAAYNPKTPGTTDPKGFIPIPDGPNDTAFKKGTLALHTVWTITTRSE